MKPNWALFNFCRNIKEDWASKKKLGKFPFRQTSKADQRNFFNLFSFCSFILLSLNKLFCHLLNVIQRQLSFFVCTLARPLTKLNLRIHFFSQTKMCMIKENPEISFPSFAAPHFIPLFSHSRNKFLFFSSSHVYPPFSSRARQCNESTKNSLSFLPSSRKCHVKIVKSFFLLFSFSLHLFVRWRKKIISPNYIIQLRSRVHTRRNFLLFETAIHRFLRFTFE